MPNDNITSGTNGAAGVSASVSDGNNFISPDFSFFANDNPSSSTESVESADSTETPNIETAEDTEPAASDSAIQVIEDDDDDENVISFQRNRNTQNDADTGDEQGDDDSATDDDTDLDAVDGESDELPKDFTAEDLQKEAERVERDAKTPKFYREQLKKVNENYQIISAENAELKAAVMQESADLTRLKEAENTLFQLQSPMATPEQLDSILREQNPQIAQQYGNYAAMTALFNQDGTANTDNLQVVLDQMTGVSADGDGRVYAHDIIQIVQGLQDGTFTPDEFQRFDSAEELAQWQAKQAALKALNEQTENAKLAARQMETARRQEVVNQARIEIQQQQVTEATQILEKYKMTPPNENDHPAIRRFKEGMISDLQRFVTNSGNVSGHYDEISKTLEFLTNAKGLTPEQARAEINRAISQNGFKNLVNAANSEFKSAVDAYVKNQAITYSLMMKGLEADAAKKKNAPDVPGATNRGTRRTTVASGNKPKTAGASLERELEKIRRQANAV